MVLRGSQQIRFFVVLFWLACKFVRKVVHTIDTVVRGSREICGHAFPDIFVFVFALFFVFAFYFNLVIECMAIDTRLHRATDARATRTQRFQQRRKYTL